MSSDPNLSGLSSMAMRHVLKDMADAYRSVSGINLQLASAGGKDVAQRVRQGEAIDLVFLAADAIDLLEHSGHVVQGSRIDLLRSGISVAVRAGSARPDISTVEALRAAVVDTPRIGYSTGPSGAALVQLFARWGLAKQLQDKLVQAPPGIPVAALLAEGTVTLGFQQTSELLNLAGIDVLGPMPEAIAVNTTFSGAVATTCKHAEAAFSALHFFASQEAQNSAHLYGMRPAITHQETNHV